MRTNTLRLGTAAALRAQDFSAAVFAARLRDLSRIV